jgi:hypothetical protein
MIMDFDLLPPIHFPRFDPMDADSEKLARLRKYEARERRHRITSVLFSGGVLILVWVLYREEYERPRLTAPNGIERLKLLFVSLGLLTSFVITLILAFRLNSVEKMQDKTEPDL